MNQDGFVEIVSFQQVEGIRREQVFQGFLILNTFYQKHKGYHGIQIAEGKDQYWTLILNWETEEAEKLASAHMMKSSETEVFKQVVNPTTFKKTMFPNYKV